MSGIFERPSDDSWDSWRFSRAFSAGVVTARLLPSLRPLEPRSLSEVRLWTLPDAWDARRRISMSRSSMPGRIHIQGGGGRKGGGMREREREGVGDRSGRKREEEERGRLRERVRMYESTDELTAVRGTPSSA